MGLPLTRSCTADTQARIHQGGHPALLLLLSQCMCASMLLVSGQRWVCTLICHIVLAYILCPLWPACPDATSRHSARLYACRRAKDKLSPLLRHCSCSTLRPSDLSMCSAYEDHIRSRSLAQHHQGQGGQEDQLGSGASSTLHVCWAPWHGKQGSYWLSVLWVTQRQHPDAHSLHGLCHGSAGFEPRSHQQAPSSMPSARSARHLQNGQLGICKSSTLQL